MNEKHLLQAILDDPSDELARLVYADWLEEHGGPDLIPRVAAMRGLCEDWDKGYLPRLTWWADLAAVHRGFVSLVKVPMRGWVRHGRGVARGHPLKVIVSDREPLEAIFGSRLFWGWFEGDGDADHAVPPCVFRHITPNRLPEDPYVFFETKQEAHDALSKACLLFARSDGE